MERVKDTNVPYRTEIPGTSVDVMSSRFFGGMSIKSTAKFAINGKIADEIKNVRTAAGTLR
jgi:hypothetical protein